MGRRMHVAASVATFLGNRPVGALLLRSKGSEGPSRPLIFSHPPSGTSKGRRPLPRRGLPRVVAAASRPPSLRSCGGSLVGDFQGSSSPTKRPLGVPDEGVGSARSSDRASAGRARTANGLGPPSGTSKGRPKINRLLAARRFREGRPSTACQAAAAVARAPRPTTRPDDARRRVVGAGHGF